MPPLQIGVSRTQTKNVAAGQTPTGRMHAAPTDRLAMAGKWARRVFAADGHGGVKTPPYKAKQTGTFPANPARGKPLPGGIYASPTNRPETAGERVRKAFAASRPRRAKTGDFSRAKCRFWG